nr:bromodomain-containing factor 1 [Ipomoea batatas]
MKGEKTHKKEPYSVSKDSRHNKKELDAAVEVIKKVMKMEAAEPFNAPVDPVALGIPDYFDVIDTPMDFGTIRTNLESGGKYLNSEDVYKDVQYIWDNCYKYNNKGDLVLDLMKRVKKNFSKYWSAAGLYSDYTQVESSQIKDATPDSTGKEQSKGGPMNNKSRKLHGLKKHKDGCLCAICVMMRRRQEREESARVLEDQMETSSEYPDEAKPEVDIFPSFLKTVYPASILSSVKQLKASIINSGLYRIHFIC